MIDFDRSRTDALNSLKSTNKVVVLGNSFKTDSLFRQFKEIWEVQTEIFGDDECVQLTKFLVALPDDFPIVLPKIYLSKEYTTKSQYLPHVDNAGYICLFDEDSISIDIYNPGGIVKECISKAITIVESGLKGINANDFVEEFIAYWEQSYSTNDLLKIGLNMIAEHSGEISDTIQCLYLQKKYRGYSIIIHNENNHFKKFKSHLINIGYHANEFNAFYVGRLNIPKPPFDFNNKEIIDSIKKTCPQNIPLLKSYLNSKHKYKLIIFNVLIDGKTLFLGWEINLDKKINGYRSNKITTWDMFTKFQQFKSPHRIKFDVYTKERLQLRTDGFELPLAQSAAFIGLGSVGSNLLQLLRPFGLSKIELIDPDILKIENINRHLLGFEYINQYKVDGLKDFFERKDLFLEINANKNSIVSILRNDLSKLNSCDVIFLAVGKDNIEQYIFLLLKSGLLKKPVFTIWLEPYLCGGHCLYNNPSNPINYDDLHEKGLYKFNIIDTKEYLQPSNKLRFKEAGCQSSFIPYGQKSLSLFLSSILEKISYLMVNKQAESFRITWKNPTIDPNDINLQISSFGQNLQSNIEIVAIK